MINAKHVKITMFHIIAFKFNISQRYFTKVCIKKKLFIQMPLHELKKTTIIIFLEHINLMFSYFFECFEDYIQKFMAVNNIPY